MQALCLCVIPSSSKQCSLLLLSIPDVCVLAWLVLEDECVLSGLWGVFVGVRKLSVSTPDVRELPWLELECREKGLGRDVLPTLLPLARERWSKWSMSTSSASLMYDSLYCFFSETTHIVSCLSHQLHSKCQCTSNNIKKTWSPRQRNNISHKSITRLSYRSLPDPVRHHLHCGFLPLLYTSCLLPLWND